MRNRRRDKKPVIALIFFGAALLCLCFMSAKLFLAITAIALIAAGIRLLIC